MIPAAVVALGTSATVIAADLYAVMDVGADRVKAAQQAQQRIDSVVQQTDALETQYKQIMKQADGLEVYNEYITRQVANQTTELAALESSIDRVSDMERQIMPLMIRMLDGLDQFVKLDVPFLKKEREDRVAGLRALMERADVSVAEKFRRLTEAFQIENDFGRTIETYKDTLVIDGSTLEVNVLRVGRIGLYYQTNDATATGRWDTASRAWVSLGGGDSRNQVRQGLRIANKQVAPDLLLLPLSAPGVAQ
jgi:hypothetical protein